jgi:hypothetical protein
MTATTAQPIYSVEEQQAIWLFANKKEAQSFDNKRAEDHRWSRVSLFRGRPFNSTDANRPTEPGPGQDGCKRIMRHCHEWWRSRDAWWEADS